MTRRHPAGAIAVAATFFCAAIGKSAESQAARWCEELLVLPKKEPAAPNAPALVILRQDYEQLEINRSVLKTPLAIGTRSFEHGLGTHSVSRIAIESAVPIARLRAWAGVDHNERTRGGAGSVVFTVTADAAPLFRSEILRGGMEAVRIDVDARGATRLLLGVDEGGDGPACDHGDWAEAELELADGARLRLDSLPVTRLRAGTRLPFSFVYGGEPSDGVLAKWPVERTSENPDGARERVTTVWKEPEGGLRVRWEATRYLDFPAVEWVLFFENSGARDTPIIADIRALSVTLQALLSAGEPYRLHRTNGAPADPSDFEPSVVAIDARHGRTMGAGGGRSSNRDFPFFRIDGGGATLIVAVGWSGQWQADVTCPDNAQCVITAGMEKTHFRLHPGEKVRSPRMLVLRWDGAPEESNAKFRELVLAHYAARRRGADALPVLFCNTCFTRGGGWLNECNAANQIALIDAYAPFGLEALLTDAGWFEGGWPAGAGNWTPRKDAYPDGMAPVAAAAKAHGMVYGLWFEPERVVAGTGLHRQHPEWCLHDGSAGQTTFLADFGLLEVQDYFFGIVKGFMALPGFRVYRQDFNMDPLPYWRHHDAPDRQGITEIKYIEGLYAYWDRLAAAWPDSLREECASGGRRVDLETVMRFHLHQKTDYWFDDEVDQASLWSLSRYLPNNTFVAHLATLDTYSFHSTLASSLCLGWIADAEGFDKARAAHLAERYRAVKPLLVGAWYPLLPYSRRSTDWIAWQHCRADLQQGAVLAFRRKDSAYRSVEVALRGIDPAAAYEVAYEEAGRRVRVQGEALAARFEIVLTAPRTSELIIYRKLPN